jgi:hypothetical protein
VQTRRHIAFTVLSGAPHPAARSALFQTHECSMPAFEDIAAAEYDESPEVLLEWLETSTSLPEAADSPPDPAALDLVSHAHLDMPHPTPSGPLLMQNQPDIVDQHNQHIPDNGSRFSDLMVHPSTSRLCTMVSSTQPKTHRIRLDISNGLQLPCWSFPSQRFGRT